jgi:hypothetical protein
VLPRATPWPAPFAAWPLDLPLVPIAALPGGATGPDQILVMAGRTSAGPAPQPVSVVSPTLVNVPSSVGFNPNDFLLVADAGDVRPCRMGQVAPSYAAMPGFPAPSAVPTGAVATGYNGPSGFAGLPGGRDYVLFNLGAAPSIQMLGVRDNQLLQYDVLQFGGVSDPVVVAENVETMVVLYGVDDGVGAGVANDNVVDGWVRVGTAPYTAAAMLAGGETTLRVKAIRVAIVLRSAEASVHEGPGSLVLFEDLPAPLRVTLSYTGAERSFARQVYDVVIPLRNQAVALCSEMRRAMGMPATGACG